MSLPNQKRRDYHREYMRRSRAVDPSLREYYREYMRRRRSENPNLNREAHAKMLANDPDYYKRWHADHRVERNAASKRWKAENPGYKRRDPEKYREQNRRDAQNRAGRRRGFRPISKKEFTELGESYLGLCAYCLDPAKHFDHVVPLSRGGPHTIENLVPSCVRCNTTKNNIPLLVWMVRCLEAK